MCEGVWQVFSACAVTAEWILGWSQPGEAVETWLAWVGSGPDLCRSLLSPHHPKTWVPITPSYSSDKFMLVETADGRIHVPFKLLFEISKHSLMFLVYMGAFFMDSFFLPNPY